MSSLTGLRQLDALKEAQVLTQNDLDKLFVSTDPCTWLTGDTSTTDDHEELERWLRESSVAPTRSRNHLRSLSGTLPSDGILNQEIADEDLMLRDIRIPSPVRQAPRVYPPSSSSSSPKPVYKSRIPQLSSQSSLHDLNLPSPLVARTLKLSESDSTKSLSYLNPSTAPTSSSKQFGI